MARIAPPCAMCILNLFPHRHWIAGNSFFFFKLTRIRFLYINVTKILVFHNFFLFQLHFAILFILTDGNFDMKEANYPVNKLFNQTALLIPLILVLSIHAKNLNILADGRNGHLISKRTRNDWLRMKLIFGWSQRLHEWKWAKHPILVHCVTFIRIGEH